MMSSYLPAHCTHLLFPLLLLLASFSPLSTAASGWAQYADFGGRPYTVTYDNRSILLNSAPTLFASGSLHYPRDDPTEWPYLMRQAREAGLNMIEFYTFWNFHQPTGPGEFRLDGRANLTRFIEAARDAGLFLNLRIGPYVCAEWNNGGIPLWLHYVPGMALRSYNAAFREAMGTYVTRIIDLTRPYFADRGGPIVLAQIENELSTKADPRYIQWCGDMANAYNVSVPWLMCNGASASNTINSCNGEDCTDFISRHGQNGRVLIDQPALWTETAGHFQVWAEPADAPTFDRPPSALSFSLVRWFARGGSHVNYYVLHGGDNFGRMYGDSVTTAYANGALLRSDGLPNQPKLEHMTRLHRTLRAIAPALLRVEAQLGRNVTLEYWDGEGGQWRMGTQQAAFVYGDVLFIESTSANPVRTRYLGVEYAMAPASAVIVQGKAVLYNTSAVPAPRVHRVFEPYLSDALVWQSWAEPLPTFGGDGEPPAVASTRPREQLELTRDATEYLWYQATLTLPQALAAGTNLSIETSNAQSFQVWVDGRHAADSFNCQHEWSSYHVTLNTSMPAMAAGQHRLTVLSTSLGISNGMNPEDTYTSKTKGVRFNGTVHLGHVNLTRLAWVQRPYLLGEWRNVSAGGDVVAWGKEALAGRPLVWYRTTFVTPAERPESGYHAVVVRTAGMGRGHLYLNGEDLGRYWMIREAPGEDPTQQYYHIPSSALKPVGGTNVLVLIEELGADDVNQVKIWTTRMQRNTTSAPLSTSA